MMNRRSLIRKQNIYHVLRTAFCALIAALGIYAFVCEGFSGYLSTKTYDVPVAVENGKVSFTAKGNLLAYAKIADNEIVNFDMKVKRGEEYTFDFDNKYDEITLHFVYTWLTVPSALLIAFRTLFMAVSLFMLIYSAWNLEKGIGLLKQGGVVRWPAAVTMSGTTLMTFNPLSPKNIEVTKFSRYIGIGLANDRDISKVIGNFTKWTAAFVALTFLYLLFFRIIGEKDKNENTKACWEFSHRFFVVAMILMVLDSVCFFKEAGTDAGLFSYSTSIVQLLLMMFFAYYVLGLGKKIIFEKYLWLLLFFGTVSLPVAIAVNDSWADGRTLFAVQFSAAVIAVLVMRFVPLPESIRGSGERMPLWSSVFIAMIPLITSFYIELISILNQHNVYIASVRKYYVLGMVLVVMLGLIPPVFVKALRTIPGSLRGICYPLIVAGITALSVQPAAVGIYEADLYETANYSVLISDFLNHGVVPIAGHYGGHMMSGVWEGILYGIINKDFFGGAMSPYAGSVSIITTLCFFYLLKNVWDEDMALFGALLFPFAGYWDYYGQGMLIAIAIIAFAHKNTLGRAVWIWVAFAWVTLYRLDMGTSFGLAAIVALAAYCIVHRSKDAAKKIGLSFLIVAGVAAVIWCGICLFADVNPFLRLMEFIKASASNPTWARETLGDTGKADFSWGYIFVPMGVALGLGYTLISRRFREDAGEERYLLLVIFGAAYAANIQRSLVRHTLAAGNYSVVLWSSLVFLALFISVKKNRSTFLPAFGAMIVFAGLLGSQEAYSENSVLETAAETLSGHMDLWTVSKVDLEDAGDETDELTFWELTAVQGSKLERVTLDEKSNNRINLFGEAMDILLDEGETYLDFENHTFLYSATGRKNPVYVSQSPMQISGEFMQEQFIKEVERENVPLAVLPATGESSYASVRLDALENAYRYYLISEYIYENYRPFCSVGEYAIWVRPECYEEKLARIRGMEEIEQMGNFVAGFTFSHLDMEMLDNGMKLIALKSDPFIAGFENGVDLSNYVGGTAKILIDYTTTQPGELKLYYTTEADESFSEAKVSQYDIKGRGTAELFVPVTDHTKLRLDIPENSTVNITSIRTASSLKIIDYGYDTFYKNIDDDILLTDSSAHIYKLHNIPLIWGELDEAEPGSDGAAYLLLELTWSGRDRDSAKTDDEYASAVLRAGKKAGSGIEEVARYEFNVKEGTHTYLIRLCSDYFYSTGDMQTFRIDSAEPVEVVSMKVINGE